MLTIKAQKRISTVKDLRLEVALNILGEAWRDVGPCQLRERIWVVREILCGSPSAETVQCIANRLSRGLETVTPLLLPGGGYKPWLHGQMD